MDISLVSETGALPTRSDDLIRPVALRPTSRARLTGWLVQGLALLALLLATDALAVLLPASRSAPQAADLASLPMPAGFAPSSAGAAWGRPRVEPTDPARRTWTTAQEPVAALGAMVAALQDAGWILEDAQVGGWLPSMPHLARLHRPGAQIFVNAWHEPADSFTRVAVVLEP